MTLAESPRRGRIYTTAPDSFGPSIRGEQRADEPAMAEPITTEGLRYGQRVAVIGIATPPIMRTPEALAVFGPASFGLDRPFLPVETLEQPVLAE